MKKIIAFAHMMKTAGTNLNRQLIGIYGSKLHMVPGGLKFDDDNYGEKKFDEDFEKLNGNLSVITGHKVRPYLNFGKYQKQLQWFTFLRSPKKRFVSHYLHDKMRTNDFAHKGYSSMISKSIEEWEEITNNQNYQTRFLAGEENLDKAIEVLENKMNWVGITEEFEEGIKSLNYYLQIKKLVISEDQKKINRNLAQNNKKEKVLDKYSDFIEEKNNLDIELYRYTKKNIWPTYKMSADEIIDDKPLSEIKQLFNLLHWQFIRQTKFRTSEININNIKRFYKRWLR